MDWEPNGAPIPASPSTVSFDSYASGSNGSAAPTPRVPNGASLFIALDTNVLIAQLSTVSEVHARLVSSGSSTWILVGQQAINELDGLSKSSRADVSSAAREATLWLDSTARGARVGRRSRLRIESRAERAAAAIETQEGVGIPAREDDAVISCCMWFQRAARVLLWTHDRNLAVLAEGSDVPTLVGRAGLLRMLREAGVEPDADEGMELDEQIMDAEDDPFPTERAARNADRVAELMPHIVEPAQQSEQLAFTPWIPRAVTPSASTAALALESEWEGAPRHRRRSSSPHFPRSRPCSTTTSGPTRHGTVSAPPRYDAVLPRPGALARALAGDSDVPSNDPFRAHDPTSPPSQRFTVSYCPPSQFSRTSQHPLPSVARSSSLSHPSRRVPPDLEALLVNTLAPVSALLDAVDPPTDALGHVRVIAAGLDALDTPDAPVERRRALIHALANARTLAALLAGERVRIGEAADALLVLADELGKFVPLNRSAWGAVAERLRQLP